MLAFITNTKNIPIIIGPYIFYLKLGVLQLKNMGAIAQEGQVQDPQAIQSLPSSCFAL